ncbi:TRAFAC clade GTPase domain-containing protein [Streptomyces lunaelactis]|uniref:TRAFAC clade GTPase domain-containing protein n=1 Tax=Streptomyces lunaelactis TaxID=1535768 RepID=UPI001585AF39|nr:hypothetical protein [Streptomyces lunaelactis]NUJ99656.1 hypothetical protein [Streptomyces lunaelactis]NUK14243.1 hypothetical protein [Streptomyces lunaelactis]
MVVRAAQQLPVRCPRCESTLYKGAAALTDVRVPVFGPTSAGKTRLIAAGLVALSATATASGSDLSCIDDDSQQAFQDATELLRRGADTARTPASQAPPPVTVQLTTSRRHRAVLHLFDASGDLYSARESNAELEYLDHAQGMVLVVDPFSLPSLRQQSVGTRGSLLTVPKPVAADPEQTYQVTAQRLRDFGVTTSHQRLAIAVVKADLLADLPVPEDMRPTPDNVRAWLIDNSLDHLVLTAERDFSEVRYFLVASQDQPVADAELSPALPFLWLLRCSGIALSPKHLIGEHK